MIVRAVLFDYGGTLDGAGSHWLTRFVALYRSAGIDLPFSRIREAFYRADEAAYAAEHIATASLRELMEFHVDVQLRALGITDRPLGRHLVDVFVTRSQIAHAVSRSVLAGLAERFRLGVVSNFYGNVERVLTDADIAPLLSVIVDSAAVGLRKPDARIFTHAVTALEALPAETLHVGDSYERDVRAARAAGLRAAWLAGDSPCGAETEADMQLRSLEDLLPMLEGETPPAR